MAKKDRDESRKYFMNNWNQVSLLKSSLYTYQGRTPPAAADYFKAVSALMGLAESTAEMLIELNDDFDKVEERLARLERASSHPVAPPTPPGLRGR
jgi:hypothetical protein